MCTLRHILPQGAMITFNKATGGGVGGVKWVNLLDATHTYCVRVCVRETITSATAWSGSKSRDQGRVPFFLFYELVQCLGKMN